MKKTVLSVLVVIFAFTIHTKAINPNVDPTIKKYFPQTTFLLAGDNPKPSRWAAALVNPYFYQFNKPGMYTQARTLYAGLARGDAGSMLYFENPELQRTLMQRVFTKEYHRTLSFEEIATLIETSEIKRIPDDMESRFAVLRIDREIPNGWEFCPRKPYRYQQPITHRNGFKPGEDEMGLWQGDLLIAPISCLNLALAIGTFDEPEELYKKDTVYQDRIIEKEKIVVKKETDTVYGTVIKNENHNGSDNTNSCGCPNPNPPAAPAQPKKVWHETLGGKILVQTGTTVLGNWIYDKLNRRWGYQTPGGGTIYDPSWPNGPTPPIVYGNNQGGSGAGNGSAPIPNDQTTPTIPTGGTHGNTWYKDPVTGAMTLRTNTFVESSTVPTQNTQPQTPTTVVAGPEGTIVAGQL